MRYATAILRRARIDADGRITHPETPEDQATSQTAATDPIEIAELRPSVQDTRANLLRIKQCPAWVARSDCGCGLNECRQGHGKHGLVSHSDCLACLKA